MENVYSAPRSDILFKEDIYLPFERVSVWSVFFLSLITLSLYLPYWLYTRTEQLNSTIEDEIPNGFTILALIVYVLSLVFAIPEAIYEDNTQIVLISSLLNLALVIMMVAWVFMFRSKIPGSVFQKNRILDFFLTLFLQIFYLQYEINVYIDETT